MKTLVAAKNHLFFALALATLATAGSASAFAQSRDHTGSMMPMYYDNGGAQVTTGAWGKEAAAPAPAVRHQQALRPTRQLIQNAGRSSHSRVQ